MYWRWEFVSHDGCKLRHPCSQTQFYNFIFAETGKKGIAVTLLQNATTGGKGKRVPKQSAVM